MSLLFKDNTTFRRYTCRSVVGKVSSEGGVRYMCLCCESTGHAVVCAIMEKNWNHETLWMGDRGGLQRPSLRKLH